ncbi:BZ3500_MvSof-1268-A1-R1_Chr7-2g09528 [Microbotryum saponariae]|uniref:BZ3500_MvSof-1268-A1-R1_Chr7-2g09528 protein n=1 Tax=Microbotryum saponariae TaxID=289078 RepID=A0A2X0L4P3_9BASI|nr:BZ3501_MvSof-1269-A2-R1_Chr7-1g09228 [Microbotryum saponariae]SDA02638.1 BZ3500_MvSof-1268-A1-R1_Chr7-2g09528 [Microbotryum saponariae]
MVAKSSTKKTRVAASHAPIATRKAYKTDPSAGRKRAPTSNGGSAAAKLASQHLSHEQVSTQSAGRKRKWDGPGTSAGAAQNVEPNPTRSKPAPSTTATTSLRTQPDEIDFVRGGGTHLTQVELKEAQLEGIHEAEQDTNHGDSMPDGKKDKSKSKRRKLERVQRSQVEDKNLLPKDAVRIEHLNYKRLVPGTKVLAQIVAVRPLELIVSLPNQLLAHVPITNISDEYTALLESAEDMLSGEGEDEQDDDDDDDVDASSDPGDGATRPEHSGICNLPTLAHWFRVGIFVSAIVITSKRPDGRGKATRRESDDLVRAARTIELSLVPGKVNEGVSKADLKTGFTLTAVVRSIEDNGYILALGVDSMSSFLPFENAQKLQPSPLSQGQVISCRIKDVNENGRTCTVTVGEAEVTGSTVTAISSINSILPCARVTAIVTAILPSGLNVKLFGLFTGTIDWFHLDGRDPETDFKVGQKLHARILWDSIGSIPKRFSLSINRHVMAKDVARNGQSTSVPLEEEFPIGRIMERVRVVRMDDEWGLTCALERPDDERVIIFAHISKLTDDHLVSIPKNGPWKVGSIHRARVIGFSALDGLVQVSLQPSVLERAFMRVNDVRVGEVIRGTVGRLTDTALFVSISGNVDGVVWPIHYADIRLRHPERKFKPGASVKARILSADADRNRVVLTLKRQLVASELPMIKSYDDAQIGQLTHGTVTRILDKAVIIEFFGGVRALIPATEAAEEYTSNLGKIFEVGKVVEVKIIRLDPSAKKITVSYRQARGHLVVKDREPVASSSTAGLVDGVKIGDLTRGEIAQIHETNVVLRLRPSNVKALISFATLSRHRAVSVQELRQDLAIGDVLDDLVVVSRNLDKDLVIVGLVPSKPKKAQDATTGSRPCTFESVKPGQVVQGKVSGVVPSGLLVQLSRNLRGRVPRTEICDDFDRCGSSEYDLGATVQCAVLSVDDDRRRVALSLRESRHSAGAQATDPAIEELGDLKVGQTIRGFVKNIASQGLFVSLSDTITARVLIKELFDEFIKDWQAKFVVGQLVTGKIMSVDLVNGQVEMSFKSKSTTSPATGRDVSGLKKGQLVTGVVKRVEPYGAFIRLEGSGITGLCHKSKVTDDDKKAWNECVKEGDMVHAVVLDVNQDTKKVSLGLKSSLIEESWLKTATDEDDEDEERNDEYEDEDEEADDDDDDDDDDRAESDDISESESSDDDPEVGSDSPDELDTAASGGADVVIGPSTITSRESIDALKAKAAPLQVPTAFNWDGDERTDGEQSSKFADDDSDSENSEGGRLRPELATVSGPSAAEDQAQLEKAPSSVPDFERLLLGSPGSSFLWIQYIAFFVSLSQLDKAREIGRRALNTISFREELEKLNVWVALLNFENVYGSRVELDALFKEAVQANDSKTIYLRLIDIYERSGKFAEEEELFGRVVKRFSQSSKVWTMFAQFYFAQSRCDEARDLLPRSLKSLEKRKHVKTVTKFAQLEFKLGDPERGRTIFEGVVHTHPRRLDIWLVYIDMEIKLRNVVGVRALFDRILATRLSSKKGKSVFKKWLAFEKDLGDSQGADAVKAKALAFVESLHV